MIDMTPKEAVEYIKTVVDTEWPWSTACAIVMAPKDWRNIVALADRSLSDEHPDRDW